jgi:hypothetical protein
MSSPTALGEVGAIEHKQVKEDVLRDPRYPVHRIADQLLPYLQVLVERFQPEQLILFGSFAYGNPDEHSDVDLLVVREMKHSSVRERRDILEAWRPLRRAGESLPFELLVVSPERHRERVKQQGGFYSTIVQKGIALA